MRDIYTPAHLPYKGNQFLDNLVWQVILTGIHVVCKSKEDCYMFKGGPETHVNFKKWGFNSIRFVIIWDRQVPVLDVYNGDRRIMNEERLGETRVNVEQRTA